MASRSLVFLLRRRGGYLSNDLKYFPCLYALNPSKCCSSGALGSENIEGSENFEENDDLKSRIFRLRLPKRSATNIIQKWVGEGNPITISDLRLISKELRKLRRYKHALEISEWIISHDEFEVSDSDYAMRIDLISKVFGIAAAERYFEGMTTKTSETYTALLHSYAANKMTERAEDLYERMKDSDLCSAITYNEMMTLYVSVGLIDKVPLIIEELKRNMVSPDIFTYNLWISSLAATQDIDDVKRVLCEMRRDSACNDDWVRYVNLADIYVKLSPVVESESGVSHRQLITYDFLLILYAGLGDKAKIDQIWKSLSTSRKNMTSTSYLCVISSYLMLEDSNGAEEVLQQWKELSGMEFDVSACGRLLDAFVEARLGLTARKFLEILVRKNCQPSDISKYEHV